MADNALVLTSLCQGNPVVFLDNVFMVFSAAVFIDWVYTLPILYAAGVVVPIQHTVFDDSFFAPLWRSWIGFMALDRSLYSAVHFPFEYGTMPQTLSEDGDPLDIVLFAILSRELML